MRRLGLIAAFSAIVPGVCGAQTNEGVAEAAVRAIVYCIARSNGELTNGPEPATGPAGFTVSHRDGRERWSYGDADGEASAVTVSPGPICLIGVTPVLGVETTLSAWMAEQTGFQPVDAQVLYRLVNPEAPPQTIGSDFKHHFRAQDGGFIQVSWGSLDEYPGWPQPDRLMIAVRALEGSTDGR